MISTQFLCTLGDDPTLKDVNGTQVAEFRGAVDIYEPSTKQRRAQWVRVPVWGARAATVAEWLHKGSQAMVVGSMTVREYEARDGRAGFSLEVKASAVEFTRGGGRESRGDSGRDNERGGGWGGNQQRGGYSADRSGGWGGSQQRTNSEGSDPIPF